MTDPPVALAHHPALRTFHWLMALLIFVALALGVTVTQLPRGELRSDILFVHKSFGVTILALVVLRVAIRLAVGAPSYREPLGRLTGIGSKAAHLALYVLMAALPISGYVISSAGGREVSWFGLFVLPNITPQDRGIAAKAAGAHFVFAWLIGIVIAAHVAAALWHAWVKRDEVMTRMWPLRRPGRA